MTASLAGTHRVDWSVRHNRYDQPTEPNEDCRHPVANHWHGTHACYVLDPCRCRPCARANVRYEQGRTAWLAGAVPSPMVDAEPARAHIERLRDAGMSLKRVAKVTGLPHGTLSKLVYGQTGPPSVRIRRETETTILECPWTLADGAYVDAREARWILAELVARGWSKAEVARRITGHPNAVALQALRGGDVRAGTLRALRLLLDDKPPLRLHGPTGRHYKPRQGYRWRRIPPSTPGVPPEGAERPLPPLGEEPEPVEVVDLPPKLTGNGTLRCDICGEALSGHPLFSHRLGRVASL